MVSLQGYGLLKAPGFICPRVCLRRPSSLLDWLFVSASVVCSGLSLPSFLSFSSNMRALSFKTSLSQFRIRPVVSSLAPCRVSFQVHGHGHATSTPGVGLNKKPAFPTRPSSQVHTTSNSQQPVASAVDISSADVVVESLRVQPSAQAVFFRDRMATTAEISISKIFPAGFGWQSAAYLADSVS